MNRRDRRRVASQREKTIEGNALKPDFTKEDVNYDERMYEATISQAHELSKPFVPGTSGPDLEDSDGVDRSIPPIDNEEEVE